MSLNADYWEKRMEELNEALINKSLDYEEHFKNSYQKAINSIGKDINNFYAKFAKENEITYAEAKNKLSDKERAAFRMEIKDYIAEAQKNNLDEEWQRRLKNASTVARIDRLQMLELQMRRQIELMEQSKKEEMTKLLSDIYEEGYYRKIYEYQKELGIGSAFSTLDAGKIEKVLSKPWNSDGQNFSDRIWNDKTKLINQLQSTFTQGIIRGDAPEKMINQLMKRMNSSYSATRTLVLTESAAFASAATQDGYKELGVERFEILVSLDEKTCDACGSFDGKVFEQKDYAVGATAPPYHPNCRCTTVPYFNDEFTKGETRAAKDGDSKTYYVPADMTYEEWKEKYVDKTSTTNSPAFIRIKNADSVSGDVVQRLHQEMDLIPDSHKDIIKSAVKEIELIETGNSRFNRKTGVLYLRTDFDKGELVHEMGHAIETKVDLYHNEEFLRILNNGIEEITPFDVIDDEDSFVKPVQRLENDKFISNYQGYLYESDIDGKERINLDTFTLNIKCLGEYFSEGYRAYLTNPELLKSKDAELYSFINTNIGAK